jgi:single-strand DNA-binding protein
MNKVVLMGNLARAVELRELGGGKTIGKTVLAVSRFGRGGERKGTDWVPIVLWDRQATNAARYLGKGSRVAIEGRIHGDFVPRKGAGEGERPAVRLVVEVVVDRITYLSQTRPAGGAEASAAEAGGERRGARS